MRMTKWSSNRRRAFGIGVVVVAAIAGSTMFGGGASAGSNPVTVTTVLISSSMSADQAGVLSDGHVSDAEMRDTVDRMVKCVVDAGYQAVLIDFSPGLGWSMSIVTETDVEDERASAAVDGCTGAYAEVMDKYWHQNLLTPAEQEVFERLVRECLAANGVQMDEAVGRSLAASVPLSDADQFNQCQVEARAQVR